MEKVLILGASGLVGRALIEEFRDRFDLYGTYSSTLSNLSDGKQMKLELQQIDQMREIIHSIKPDIVISCLRGKFVHQLKFHKELAMVLRRSNSLLYYFSTTNVFDGDYSKPHTETDIPFSESDYGNFKIKCENMLKEILDDRLIIIRIPAIWGRNSPRWSLIKESINKNEMLDVYSNLVCNNLLDVLLAKQLMFIIKNKFKGIFHLVSEDMITQSQFYEQIISAFAGNKSILRNSLFQDSADLHYFALKSTRDEIRGPLKFNHIDIISYLINE